MSAWPKTVAVTEEGRIISEAAPSEHRLQVVPASLARELYEALMHETGSTPFSTRSSTAIPTRELLSRCESMFNKKGPTEAWH